MGFKMSEELMAELFRQIDFPEERIREILQSNPTADIIQITNGIHSLLCKGHATEPPTCGFYQEEDHTYPEHQRWIKEAINFVSDMEIATYNDFTAFMEQVFRVAERMSRLEETEPKLYAFLLRLKGLQPVIESNGGEA